MSKNKIGKNRLLKDVVSIIKHPLTDNGLAQFLADHAKVNS